MFKQFSNPQTGLPVIERDRAAPGPSLTYLQTDLSMSSATGAGSSRRRGHYSARACNECRRRRVKCDGKQPVCDTWPGGSALVLPHVTCHLPSVQCEWSTEADARRPVTKQLVESLHTRIRELEAELLQLGGKPSTLPSSTHIEPFARGLTHQTAGQQSLSQDPVLAQVSKIPLDFVKDISDIKRLAPPVFQLTTTAMYRYIFQIDTTTPTIEHPRDVQLSLVCDWSRYLPELPDTPLSRLEHDTLLLRCFKYGTSWLLSLVPELFLHDMLYFLTTGADSPVASSAHPQHYSPLLHCSIMAYSSAFSDDPDICALATRARFAERAKQWLDQEFNQPVMCLVSALALLAEYHCAIGEQESGYMYMGMGIRVARLMVSTSNRSTTSVESIGTLPESIARDWYIWSAFAHDKLMAIEFKRDYDMPVPHSGISLPSIIADFDQQPWSHEGPTDMANLASPARLTTLAFHEASKLAIIAARIVDMYIPGEVVEEHTILNIHLRLDTWFNNLPEKLLVWARSASPLPHVIVLHICYWWFLIVLHEPLYKDPLEGEGNLQESGAEQQLPITDLSIKVYNRAAHKIVQLLNMFDNQYGLRFLPRNMIEAVCSCGTALLRELTATHPGAHKKRSTSSTGPSTTASGGVHASVSDTPVGWASRKLCGEEEQDPDDASDI
ncbi:Fungal specific transcription factor domain [Ceratobasidium sp. AG-Ba]|nr:Fungal specific transcription factor domain [Ceratobasidium sp. AG-Ba]